MRYGGDAIGSYGGYPAGINQANVAITGGTISGVSIASPTITGTVTNGGIIIAQSGAAVIAPADTVENTLATIAIPANAMGTNGRIKIRVMWTSDGSAGNKTYRVRFGGTEFYGSTRTTTSTQNVTLEIMNLNSASAQRGSSTLEITSGGVTFDTSATGTIDTTAARNVTITVEKATGSEVITLIWYYVELWKV